MVDAGDARRQLDALDRLIALKSPCGNEPCSLRHDVPRLDGLVRSDEDGVDP